MLNPTEEQLKDPVWWNENAPKGATHYCYETDNCYEAFYKDVTETGCMYWLVTDNDGWYYSSVSGVTSNLIERPVVKQDKTLQRVTQITVVPEGEPIFSENAFIIQIEDDAGGEYISVRSNSEYLDNGQIKIDKKEWVHLRAAIDVMFEEIKED